MKEPTIVRIETPIHGRVIVRQAGESPAPMLVGFHGYGENSEKFLEAVAEIPGVSNWHVVIIQALHPFYNLKTGTVVASWMTSQDRELAISDNIAYVAKAVKETRMHVDHRPPTAFVSFSQGTAMAYRAACLSDLQCDGLIALAGDVPDDVEAASSRPIPRILVGRGAKDTWYDQSKFERDVARLNAMGVDVETCVFDGGHEWTDEFRTACAAFLDRLLSLDPDETSET